MHKGYVEASWDHTANLLLQQAMIHGGKRAKHLKLYQFHPYRQRPKVDWDRLPKAEIGVLKDLFLRE